MADRPLAQHDFYNPFMSAALVDGAGNRVPLWTDLKSGVAFEGENLEGKYGIRSLPWLKEVSVSMNLGDYPNIRATLTPPYQDAIAFLDSPLIEWGRSILEVELGYIHGPSGLASKSPVFQGVCLKPEVQLGADIEIVLTAQGVGAFTLARQESGRQLKGTRREIIEEIVRTNADGDRKLLIDQDSLKEALNDDISGKKLTTVVKYSQGYKTDLQALWDVVREASCWISFIEDKLHIIPRGRLRSTPKLTLALYEFKDGEIGPNARVFPILNASSPTMAVYLPASSFGLRVKGINSAKAAIEEFIADEISSGVTGGQATQSDSIRNEKPAYFGDINDEKIKDQANYEFERTRTLMGVNLEIDTLGIPDLLPGDVVNVRGLGKRISGAGAEGNYGVFNVTHVYGTGGYTTSMVTVSNSSALYRSAHKKKFGPGVVNDKTIPTGPTESGTLRVLPERLD